MSIVDTWDWDKLKLSLTEDSKEEDKMRCEGCNHKFVPFNYFVIGHRIDNDEEFFMCEECFFNLALCELGFREAQMNHDATSYYDSAYDDSEEEWVE